MSLYSNSKYNFSIFYPEGLKINEYPDKTSAITITFQNTEEAKGFQIFIVPYSDSQISKKRFLADIPSGIRLGEKEKSCKLAVTGKHEFTNSRKLK
jgi:hypothetical protein